MDHRTQAISTVRTLLNKLAQTHSLSLPEYRQLLEGFSPEAMAEAGTLADGLRKQVYGNQVFIRGLVEVGNICKNDCYYCGIRRSNHRCQRYRLSREEILNCCEEGYSLGFRTFVMQGGEGVPEAARPVCDLIRELKRRHPDCAVTLSLGEYPREIYQEMFNAGADRYLLRHETANRLHYEKLHPAEMSFDNRMRCLRDLQEIGFQTGCGFMVGSPYQTLDDLALDLKFIEDFHPAMCGIGPFLPHKDTPFGDRPAGTRDLTLYLLSILRIQRPDLLLPATTALGTVSTEGHRLGMQAGANVIMPNLSPLSVRAKYMLYDGKAISGSEAAEGLAMLKASMAEIGYEVVVSRGDPAISI